MDRAGGGEKSGESNRNPASTFAQTQELCCEACEDVNHMAELAAFNINVENILNNLHLVDINDCIYYEFCSDEGIELYY